MVTTIFRSMIVLLLGAGTVYAQTTTNDRQTTLERLVIGSGTLGTTSPLQVVGLPTKTSQTACAWLDASGNVYTGACPTGTVTSVGLTMPGIFSVANSPVTSSGTLTVTLANQNANLVFAGPASGAAAAPTFRSLVKLDLPSTVVHTDQTNTYGAFLQTFTTLTASGAVNLNGGLAMDSTAFTVADGTGNTSIAGTLGVTGLASLNGGIAVDSTNFTVSGTTGAVSTASTLGASGLASLNGGIAVDSTAFTVADTTGNTSVGGTLGVTGIATFSSTAQASGWASRTSNWGITAAGSADFRDLFSDEMRVRTFTTEMTQAVNGSMLWTRSVTTVEGESTVGGAVTCPTAGGATENWWFRDFDNAASTAMRVFQNGDYVAVRVLSWADSGADGAAELGVSDCIVSVTSYVDGTSGNEGYQQWTVTRPASGGGGMANGGAIPLKTQVLNFGVTADGFLLATVSDGTNNTNAPYFGVQTWATTPAAANWTTRARLGQLRGITSTDEYGLLAGTYAASAGKYFRASDANFDLHGITLKLWDADTANLVLDPGASSQNPYLAIGNPAPTTYASGEGLWAGSDSGTYKFRIGTPGANQMSYDSGTDALVVTGSITGSTVTGSTVTGGTVQTYDNCGAAGVGCVEMQSNELRWYNSSNTLAGTINGDGINIPVSNLAGGDAWRSYGFAGGASSGWARLTSAQYTVGITYGYVGLTNSLLLNGSSGQNVLSLSASGDTNQGSSIVMYGQRGTGTGSMLLESRTFEFKMNNSTARPFYVDAAGAGVNTTSITSGYALDVNGAALLRSGATIRGATSTDGYLALTPGSATNIGYLAFHAPTTAARQGYLGWGASGVNLTLENSANFNVTGGYVTVNHSGGIYVSGGGGTDRLFNISSSGFAIDATNNGGNPSFLNYNASTFLNETLYLGYTNGGTTTLTTYYSSQNMEIVPTGALYINPGGTARVYFTDTDIQVNGIYNNSGAWAATGGTTTLCDNGGWIYRCTSSARWKTNIQTAREDWSRILDVRSVLYDEVATEHNPNPDKGLFGAIAEEFDALGLTPLVGYGEDGLPESLRYERVALYLIPLVKEQRAQIAALETRLAALEARATPTCEGIGCINTTTTPQCPSGLMTCTLAIPPVCTCSLPIIISMPEGQTTLTIPHQ